MAHREGERDRALYVLSDGRLERSSPAASRSSRRRPPSASSPSSTGGRAAGLRALTHGEAQRLSYDAFEALSAREPRLARDLLLDLGRIVAARLRGALEAERD
jgi:hypothetical protein